MSGSIFSTCTRDKIASQPGVNYPNSLVEVSPAINPADTSNLLFAVQQDRWNNGGARGPRSGISTDGESAFAVSSTPGATERQGRPWPRFSGPWVSFSPNGAAYESALAVKESASTNPNVLAAASGQVVSRSTDGGMTWGQPTTLIADHDPKHSRRQELDHGGCAELEFRLRGLGSANGASGRQGCRRRGRPRLRGCCRDRRR